jgi:hypothetical protein
LRRLVHEVLAHEGTEGFGGDVAADLFRHGLCLPSSSSLTAEEQGEVIEVERAVAGRPTA